MIILGTNSIKDTGYNVANSLRFNSGSSDSLSRTPSSASNRRTFTFSSWIKRSALTNFFSIFNGGTSGSIEYFLWWNDDTLAFSNFNAGDFIVRTNAKFRDVSAWYHLVLSVDSTQGTAANRIKIYVNGVQETSLAQSSYPDENYDFQINNNVVQYVGHNEYNYMNGYMAETVLIDGLQLAPTSFGEFDSDNGIWKPIDVSGLTFGTNGFYLEYKQAGTSANSSGLGADTSGNDHHFTVNNLTAVDQTTDTCTNNFMTLNPLITLTSVTDNQVYSEGNTIVIPNSTDNYGTAFGTFGATKGKWYWEAQIIWNGTSNNANFPKQIGFMREDYAFNKSYLGQNDDQTWGVGFADLDTDGWGLDHNGSFGAISGATTLADDKMVMFALDLDNGKFYMGYDGTFFTSGDPTSGATGTGAIATLDATDLSFTIIPALTNATNTTYYKMNFGNPAYAIASSNADGNGFGNFEFAVPSGYFSWCTKNLSEYG